MNMPTESESARKTAHRLGGADDLETARRSRTKTATSATPSARLNGISQKSSASTMEGNTSKNHTSDDAFKASVRIPIHVVQITTGRELPRRSRAGLPERARRVELDPEEGSALGRPGDRPGREDRGIGPA